MLVDRPIRALLVGSAVAVAAAVFPFATTASARPDSGPPPTVTGVSLTKGSVGGGTVVTVTGTAFADDSTVDFGAEAADDVTVVSATEITATSPAADQAGAVDVTVMNDDGTSATSSADQFTYIDPVALVATQGKNGSLYVSADGGGFVSYGGALKGTPTVLSTANRNFYFVRGTNNNLYVRSDTTAFTNLRPSAALACATAPEATSLGAESTDGFLVGCVGTNGYLYTMTGSLPATGNPVATSAQRSSMGHFNSDLTSVKGGVGTDPAGGDLLVTGTPYTASSPVATAGVGGNVYVDEVRENNETFGVGGTCAGSPDVAFGSTAYFIACKSETSPVTLSYAVTEGQTPTIAVTNLGGQSKYASAVIVAEPAKVFDVVVTGTNGRFYDATVNTSTNKSPGFQPVPIPAGAVSGPGVGLGLPPSDT